MATVKYVQTRDPDTGQLSEKHLLEVVADNVIFEEENMTLPQKMDTKADKIIYGDNKISKGRYYNSTEGEGSIAFGINVQAINQNSTALGNNTIVNSAEGLVTGRYNIIDSDEKYAFIIGNGSLDAAGMPKRSNAFAVDWNGNIYGNKFVDMDGHEALTTLKNIRVGDNTYELHGTTLHLVAGHNIVLNSLEIESDDVDGTTSHILQVTITADKNAAGDGTGSGGGLGDGLYLPLIGGTEYGPVVFNNVYDRTKFTTAEREAFIKNSPYYSPDLSDEEKEALLFSMNYIPIVVGNPSQTHLDIDCTSTGKSVIDSYNEKNRQGDYLYLNKSKGIVIIGASAGNGIVWNPKKRSGGTGININNIGTASFGWGTGVSPTGQNSIALGATTRASGSSSFAVGDSTRASGVASFAEGIKTIAGGSGSHAEGSYTITRASYSHTEGYGTITGGLYSHNEGYGSNSTVAITEIDRLSKDKDTFQDNIISYWDKQKFSFAAGNNLHIEGKDNIGFGINSHIEGIENLNQSDGSHIEGIANIDKGEYTHTEGGYNFTLGQYLHTEGFGGKNEGFYSHIFGYGNASIGKYNSIGGMLNENNGNKNFIFGKHILICDNNVIAIGKDIYIKGNESEKYSFIFGINIGVTDNEFPEFISSRKIGSVIFGSCIKTNNNIANNPNFIFGSNLNLSTTDFNNSTNNLIFVKDGDFSPFTTLDNNIIFGKNLILKLDKCINSIIIQNKEHNLNTRQKINNQQIENSYIFGSNVLDKEEQIITSSVINGGNKIYNLKTQYSFISGWNNEIYNNISKSFIIGYENKIEESNNNLNSLFLFGNNNIVKNTYLSFIFGNNILLQTDTDIINSYIIGYNHNINGNISNAYIEGINHTIKANAKNVIHIEGDNNYILPDAYYAHIEGTLNSSLNSHVEGEQNYGGGLLNHIEGKNNITTDEIIYLDSNLEDFIETIFISQNNHIEGCGSIAAGSYSHIEGGSSEQKIDILKLALNQEELLLNQINNYDLHIDLGSYSHIEGYINFSNSLYAHVEGKRNINLSVNTHIEGSDNIIYGISDSAHIENIYNTIYNSNHSHMEGFSNRVIGKSLLNEEIENNLDVLIQEWNANAFALIYNSDNSHLEGVNNFIYSNQNSHMEGINNKAFNGIANHTEGKNIINSSLYGHAEGVSLFAINSSNITYELWKENPFSYITGTGGHLEGCNNWIENDYGHIEGVKNASLNMAAHVEGIENIATGIAAHAQGQKTIAEGDYSFTAGYNNIAKGQYSIAFGESNLAETDYSFVTGKGLITQGEHQVVFGKYNEITEDDKESLVVVGNGKNEEKRNTIFRITKEGMVQAASFATMDGSPIGGGQGEDLPIGTIIINQNPNNSGFKSGNWQKLGKKIIELLDDDDNPITYTTYYWKRVENWIIPDPNEKYIKDGIFIPDEEGYYIDDPRPNPEEEYYKD